MNPRLAQVLDQHPDLTDLLKYVAAIGYWDGQADGYNDTPNPCYPDIPEHVSPDTHNYI